MVPDSIVLTFDVRLPPTTDLAEWELMLLVTCCLTIQRVQLQTGIKADAAFNDTKDRYRQASRQVLIMNTGLVGGGRRRNHCLVAAEDD